jgi:hypothetical protein
MSKPSRYWSRLSLIGLRRVGDVLACGEASGDALSFSKLGCADHVDRLLEYMPEQDMRDLGLVFAIFAFFPKPFVRLLMFFFSFADRIPTWLGGGLLRLLWMGLRGVVFSLYYSGYIGKGVKKLSKVAGVVDYRVEVGSN